MARLGDLAIGIGNGLKMAGDWQKLGRDKERAGREDELHDVNMQRYQAMLDKNRMEMESITDERERKKRIAALWKGHGALESGDFSQVSPEDVQTVYGDEIAAGSDDKTKKSFKRFVPGPDGKSVMVELDVERDGKKTTAPVTMNRSSDPGDAVVAIPMQDLYMDMQAKKQSWLQLARKLAAEGDDSLMKEIMKFNMKEQGEDGKLHRATKLEDHKDKLARERHKYELDNPGGEYETDAKGNRVLVKGASSEFVTGPDGEPLNVGVAGSKNSVPADIQVTQFLQNAMQNDPEALEAWKMYKQGSTDIRSIAGKLVDTQMKAQSELGIQQGDNGYRTMEQMYQDTINMLQSNASNEQAVITPDGQINVSAIKTDQQVKELFGEGKIDRATAADWVRQIRSKGFIEKKQTGPGAGLSPQQGLPQGITEDDILATMQANNMTREQVLAELQRRSGAQ